MTSQTVPYYFGVPVSFNSEAFDLTEMEATPFAIVDGGGGDDFIRGHDGGDVLYGGLGRDIIVAGDGNNVVLGDGGNFPPPQTPDPVQFVNDDFILTGGGADTIITGGGNNYVNTGDSADSISGGAEADILFGGWGNDSIYGGAGNDYIAGGSNISFVMSLTFKITTYWNGVTDTQISTTYSSNWDSGVSVVVGYGPDHSLDDGRDYIDAGDGDDYVLAQGGNDSVLAGGGNDTVIGGLGNDIVDGGSGNDHLMGDAGSDQIAGQAGHDVVRGGADNDYLSGQGGTDLIDGGLGNDLLTGGSDSDVFYFRSGDGVDTITDFVAGGFEDVIDLIGTQYTNFDQIQASLHFYSGGNATYLDFSDGGRLYIENVLPSHLDQSDFWFNIA